MFNKEVFESVMFLIEIERKRQEKLAQVRRELAFYESREEPQPDRLSVKLY